jgi:hypothetical protein
MLIFLQELVLRVLHRLRSLSEQTPLDSATFSYAFPLLFQVIQKGGIGSGEDDETLEQVALSLDIIKFHCGECTSCSQIRLLFDPSIPPLKVRMLLSHGPKSYVDCYMPCALSQS